MLKKISLIILFPFCFLPITVKCQSLETVGSIAKDVYKIILLAGDDFKSVTGDFDKSINDSVKSYHVKNVETKATAQYILMQNDNTQFYVAYFDSKHGDALLSTQAVTRAGINKKL